MKKHLSKRLLSLFLAVVMVVTCAPFVAFATTEGRGGNSHYLFAYFTGDSDESVRLAVSDDGLNFEALNGNLPVLEGNPSEIYTVHDVEGIAASGKVRDPYILPKQDGSGFYILGTDLETYGATDYRNSKLLIWDVPSDSFDQIESIKPWAVETAGWFSNYQIQQNSPSSNGRADFYAWAPEAIWDSSKNMYMMYWSAGTSKTAGENYDSLRVHYAYTSDFKTFCNADGQEINAANGVEPQVLYDPGYQSIDADILKIDDNKYWMVFKDERSSGKTIHYATSTSLPGNWQDAGMYTDSDLQTPLEGPFLYQLPDDSVVLMADYYSNNVGYFISMNNNDINNINNFTNNSISRAVNINYLSPRHGNICKISEDEYNNLVNSLGKVTFDGTGLTDNTEANDHLVARYFVNDQVESDTSGNGYNLDTHNLTASFENENTYANFTANGGTSGNPGSGSYASVNMAQMAEDNNFNSKDGITISWYSKTNQTGYERYFDLTTTGMGTLGNAYGEYAFVSTNGLTEMQHDGVQYQTDTSSTQTGQWHLYTVTITDRYMCLSVDGNARKSYWTNKGVKQFNHTPLYGDTCDSTWFDALVRGTLYIGASSYSGDALFEGGIYDFRIYDRALGNADIDASLEELNSAISLGDDVDIANRIFYDPMEDTTVNGQSYTSYDNTVNDSTMGNVLSTNGSYTGAHNDYAGQASDNGYTISFWYNPGSDLNGAILTLGDCNQSGMQWDEDNKKYFTITETGELWFCYNDGTSNYSYADITNLFNGELLTDEWQHITIQFAPNGSREMMYVYVAGSLVNQIDCYHYANTQDGRTFFDFFTNLTLDVSYGAPANTGYGWSNGSGFIDDVSIYKGLYSAESLLVQDAVAHADTLLNVAVQNYKEKMASIAADGNSLYTNMANAYDAYDRAQRYLDATNPQMGGVTYSESDDKLHRAELYYNLTVANNAMEVYEKPQDINGLTQGQTRLQTAISSDYTNNMLSTVSLDLPKERQGGSLTSDSGQNMSILSGPFVWMYTGNPNDTPTAPIGGGVYWQYKRGVAMYGSSIYVESGDVLLNQDWKMINPGKGDSVDHGGNLVSTIDWYYDNPSAQSMGHLDNNDGPNFYVGESTTGGSSGGGNHYAWNYGSNVLSYDETDASSKFVNGNGYYYSFEPVYKGRTRTTWWELFGGDKEGFQDHEFASTGKIYVINYAKVKDAMLKYTSYLKNITSYTPESASALLTAYDNLTSTNYIFNVVSEANVADLASELKQKVDALNAVILDNRPVEKADDTLARQAVEEESQDFPLLAEQRDQFTVSSWSAYDNAYNALKNYYGSLDPYGANREYSSSQDYVDNFALNLDSASQHLVKRADYTNVVEDTAADSQYTTDYNSGNGTDTDSQIYTYTSWKPFVSSYETADAWADKPIGYKQNTPMYEVNFQKYDGTPGASEAKYPYIAVNLNEDGHYSIVNNANQITDETLYVYYHTLGLDGFYEKQGDQSVSQFETGEWIFYEGSWINLNGCRFAPTTVANETEEGKSTYQNSIDTAHETLVATVLDKVADYSAYNATTDLLKYQDIAAFTDEYISTLESSVYAVIAEQGTEDKSVTYASGLEGVESIVCTTPEYVSSEDEKAYVSAENRVWKDTSMQNQGTLDLTTSSILQNLELDNTTNDSVRRKVDVTYNYVVGEDGVVNQYEKTTVNYGDNYLASAPEGYSVYKWVVEADNSTMTIPASESYNAKITKPVTITAYCSTEAIEGQVTVKVLNQYGHLIQEYTVSADTTLNLSDNQYTIGDYTESMPVTPFYKFAGWTVNGKDCENGDVDLSAYGNEVTIKPVLTVDSDTYNITVDGEKVVLPNGENIDYDSYITVKPAEGSIGLAVSINGNYYAVSYGTDNYSFFACGNIDFYSIYENEGAFTINGSTVTDEATINKLNNRLPFVYSLKNVNEENQFFTYSASTANIPEGAEVTEVGTIYTTNADVANHPNAFVIGAEGVSSVSAKNQLETMQYYLGINNPSDIQIYTRAYVKYSYKTNVSEGNVNEDTVIQTVDYGNICSSK